MKNYEKINVKLDEQDNVILICRKADEQRIKEFSTQLR